MYSAEELNRKINNTTDNVKRWFLMSQLLTNNWVELIRVNEQETISDEEYFERLIFSTFFIFKSASPNEVNEKQKFMSDMIIELMHFSTKFGNFENKLGGSFSQDMVKFIINRYSIIESEIKEMKQGDSYTTPFLIYNLYINPTNTDKPKFNDIMEEIGGMELMKQSLLFIAHFKFFLQMLDEIIQSVE